MPKATNFESAIQSILTNATARIVNVVRSDMASEVRRIAGLASSTARTGAKRGRRLGVSTSAPKTTRPSREAKSAKFVRRAASEIEADNSRLLAYIKSNPGQSSENIQEGTGLPKAIVAPGLRALRDAGQIKVKGEKRAAKYTAA